MNSNDRMPTKVAVLTENRFLYQKIKLELGDMAECFMPDTDAIPNASIRLVDKDSHRFKDSVGLSMSYTDKEADVKLPFEIGSLKRLVFGKTRAAITVDKAKKQVQIGGRVISLTDVELALFCAIYKRGGEYASRDTLLQEVWGGACDGGVINVYVHYLREKLEEGGEKVILCSRKCGYAISEKFIGGDADA